MRSASAILRTLPIGRPTHHMDQGLKERLVGAAVLVAIAVWLIPWVLDGPEAPLETRLQAALQLPAAEEPMPMRTQTLRLGDAAEEIEAAPATAATPPPPAADPVPVAAAVPPPVADASTCGYERAERGHPSLLRLDRRRRAPLRPRRRRRRRPLLRRDPRRRAAAERRLDGAARQLRRGGECAPAWRSAPARSATRPRFRRASQQRADAVPRPRGRRRDREPRPTRPLRRLRLTGLQTLAGRRRD